MPVRHHAYVSSIQLVDELTIDGSQLSNGVYFYTVRAGEAKVTKKMIVE